MTLEFGQELAQEGDFQEDVAKEISVVKGGRISLDHYYSSCCPDEIFRQIYNGYQKALRQRRKLVSMTCFFAAMNFLSREKISWRHGKTNSNTLW